MKKSSEEILAESRALLESIERTTQEQTRVLHSLGVPADKSMADMRLDLSPELQEKVQAQLEKDLADVEDDVARERLRLEFSTPGTAPGARVKAGRRRMI